MASKKVYLKKVTIDGVELANLTDHQLTIYQNGEIIETIEKSGVEARIAYTEPIDHFIGKIPVNRRIGNRLIFYYQSKPIPYRKFYDLLGNAIPIVSSICLPEASLTFDGRAISPGQKVNLIEGENGKPKVMGTKNFIIKRRCGD